MHRATYSYAAWFGWPLRRYILFIYFHYIPNDLFILYYIYMYARGDLALAHLHTCAMTIGRHESSSVGPNNLYICICVFNIIYFKRPVSENVHIFTHTHIYTKNKINTPKIRCACVRVLYMCDRLAHNWTHSPCVFRGHRACVWSGDGFQRKFV